MRFLWNILQLGLKEDQQRQGEDGCWDGWNHRGKSVVVLDSPQGRFLTISSPQSGVLFFLLKFQITEFIMTMPQLKSENRVYFLLKGDRIEWAYMMDVWEVGHSSSDLRTSMRETLSLRKAHLSRCLTKRPESQRFLREMKRRKRVRRRKQSRKRYSWYTCDVRLKITLFWLNLNLLNSYSALQPTCVTRPRFWIAGRYLTTLPGRASLKMQSPLTRVSLGRFSRCPVSTMEWLSSQNLKLIWFSLVMRLRASRMRYSSKKTSLPSISSQGLPSMVQSSPKLYLTCTRQLSPLSNTSLLSTKFQSNRITERYSSFPNSTAQYSTWNDAARAAMKSEGNFSPISTTSPYWCAGNDKIDTDRLQSSMYSWSVGLVEQTEEWLKEMRTGSFVIMSQSNTQVRGIRTTPPALAA